MLLYGNLSFPGAPGPTIYGTFIPQVILTWVVTLFLFRLTSVVIFVGVRVMLAGTSSSGSLPNQIFKKKIRKIKLHTQESTLFHSTAQNQNLTLKKI